MICPSCKLEADSIKSVIVQRQILNGCDSCLDTLVQGDSASYERKWQRKQHARDIVQPNDKDFVRAWGADRAREWGYSEGEIRKRS